MDITALFATAFLVGLSGAMMPGPLLTVTIAESARRGFVTGPMIMLGHAILEFVLIIALIGGLSAFLTRDAVTTAIAVVGGSFLLYLGFTMSREALTGQVQLADWNGDAAAGKSKGMPLVLAGIVISISNPYWILWWATVGLTYLTMALEMGSVGVASFFSGHILADLMWYSAVAAAVAGGRKFISDQIYRYVIVICGIFLLGLGVYFIYSGIIG